MRATALTLAAAALAAGTFLLTGCEPGDTVTFNGSGTYNAPKTSNASNGPGVGCDPKGFGPLSGCDSSSAGQEQSPQATVDKPAPGRDDSADKTTEAQPTPCPDDSHDLDVGAGRFGDTTGSGCDNSSDAEQGDQKITVGRYDVTITWIVMKIEFTGFRECVLDLQDASAKSEDHFSRRITTTKDCKAQQVHTVYRPVDGNGK